VVLAPNQRDTQSTRFMGFHTVLQTQSDFIGSLREARKLASHISAVNQLDVYVYSSFYVYFEQYLYIEGVAALSMGLAATAIFALSLVILRNLFASLLILSTIAMILVDLFGVMALWSISLNAVSAVNLSMAIGISVEFCIHVTVAFLRSRGSRDFRVAQALIGVGSSVVSGITLTKFLGVIALIAAPSAIFRVYYFRMYFAIVLLGASHGLIFLPVLLSLVGPRTPGSDADAEADADADGKRGASAVPSDSAGDLYASLKDDGCRENAR
jgi:Niemann-Pick C1 protein